MMISHLFQIAISVSALNRDPVDLTMCLGFYPSIPGMLLLVELFRVEKVHIDENTDQKLQIHRMM